MAVTRGVNDGVSKFHLLKLLQAISTKDVDQVVKLIKNGVPDLVNARDTNEGIYGIHMAASANDETLIEILVGLGAKCNVTDNKGRTPYMRAAAYGHVEALSLLLKLCDEPDLDNTDIHGRNVLHYCLHDTKRHEECTKLCIENGANVHAMSDSGKSLLIEACESNLATIMEMLLNAMIDTNKTVPVTGETALHVACRRKQLGIARILLSHGADPDVCDSHHFHCAHKAARNDDVEFLKLLSGYGGDLGTLNGAQQTPMHLAAERGLASTCKFLGQRGCPANLKDANGFTPRQLAKDNGHKLAIKACKNAEKNTGEKPGTQLHLVMFYDWLQENMESIRDEVKTYDPNMVGTIRATDMTTVLEVHNCPLDAERLSMVLNQHDKQRTGVISYEIFFSGKRFINKLFLTRVTQGGSNDRGGNRRQQQNRKTKVELPICTKDKIKRFRPEASGPLANFIEKHEEIIDHSRFNRDKPAHTRIDDDSYWYCTKPVPEFIHVNEAVSNSDVGTLKYALNRGYNINNEDEFYKTPLMHACADGNFDLVKFLIRNKADVNALDNFKWAPIHFACHSGQTDMVELLLNKGCLVDAQTLNGGTPLMRAVESGNPELVQLLIDRGADVFVKTKNGLTALKIARSYSTDLDIINILKKRISQLPPPVTERKRKFSLLKPVNKVTDIPEVTLPDIEPSKEALFASTVAATSKRNSFNNTMDILSAPPAESLCFQVQRPWLPQLRTKKMIEEKDKRRERFGVEVDFEGYKPPFQGNIDKLISTIEGSTDIVRT